MGKAKKQTVGYQYFMGIHMGLGRGPVNEICEIKVGDRTAWSGSITGNTTVDIRAGDLFGGNKGEGGIDGPLEVMMGGAGQTMGTRLRKMLEGPQSQFRGITSVFFNGLICAMSPYPKPWKFRVRRHTSGWDGGVWYPEKCVINMTGYKDNGETQNIQAMNPAHIIYEAMTNREWGLGRPRDMFLENTWLKAADQLYAENFGLCLRWGRQDTIMSFVQTVIDHIGAAVYVDKFTGLYKLKLIRNDYDADSLPIFDTDSGLLSIDEATNVSPYNLVNEIVVNYHNPITDEDSQQRAHNLALIQTQGALNSDTRDYPGIPSPGLALWVAKRDLKSASTNVRRFSLTCDRRAWRVQPGDVFKIRDPDSRGLETVIVRVGSNEESGQDDGKIKIVCVQDMFGVDLNTFGQVQPPAHVEPSADPAIARRLVYEFPYAELVRVVPDGEMAAMKELEGYFHAHAEKPTNVSMAFDILVRPEGGAGFVENGGGDFTPLGEINTLVQILGKEIYLNPQTISLDFDWDELEVGMGLAVQNDAGIAIEMMRLEGWDESLGKLVVGRGSMDTIPHRLFAGWVIWVSHDNGGSDNVKYLSGEKVDMKILPWTLRGGRYPEDIAPIDSITFNHRQIRPLPPGNVQTNTIYAGTKKWYDSQLLTADAGTDEVPDRLLITWSHRDRIIQQDVLVPHEAGDIGPEPGQTYRLRVLNGIGTVVRNETGVAGTQIAYTYQNAAQDLDVENQSTNETAGTILLDSMRAGYESWQYYTIPFTVRKKPPQSASVASFAMIAADDPAEDDDVTNNDQQGAQVASKSMQTSQDDTEITNGDSDNANANVAAFSENAGQDTKLPPVVDFYLYEMPYITMLRDGRPNNAAQALAFVARPSDRITDGYDLFDRKPGGEWNADGAQPWCPWGQLKGFVSYLTNEIELDATSDTDGVPIGSVMAGDILLCDNELMKVVSVNGKIIKVGRGSVDTIPAVHYAKAVVWLFDRSHAAGGLTYDDTGKAQVAVLPHVYGQPLTIEDAVVRELQMQSRWARPYPPGLLLADGNHWFERVVALPDGYSPYDPKGKSVLFSWAHRNRVWQDDRAYDHFDSGIPYPEGVQYRIWIGYRIPSSESGAKATLYETYTSDAGFVLPADLAETLGERAGRALNAPGIVQVEMAINSKLDTLYNWQGYGMVLVLPSYPMNPGDKPGGGTITPDPTYPPEGSGGDNGGGTPGDGGTTDPTPDPQNPDPNPDPDVPPTEPPGPDPEPEPDPDNVYGWSMMWDHGWAADLPQQQVKDGE